MNFLLGFGLGFLAGWLFVKRPDKIEQWVRQLKVWMGWPPSPPEVK